MHGETFDVGQRVKYTVDGPAKGNAGTVMRLAYKIEWDSGTEASTSLKEPILNTFLESENSGLNAAAAGRRTRRNKKTGPKRGRKRA